MRPGGVLDQGIDHIAVPAELCLDIVLGHHGHSRWTHGYLSLELASLLYRPCTRARSLAASYGLRGELYTRFVVALWMYALPWCSGAVFTGRFQLACAACPNSSPLLLLVTAIDFSVTQGPLPISEDQLCCFQAVILQKTLHRFFRGRDSMKCNLESHRSFFPQHSTHLPRLRQARPTRLNPRSFWCILWGPGVRYAFLHTRRPSPLARFQGVNDLEASFYSRNSGPLVSKKLLGGRETR